MSLKHIRSIHITHIQSHNSCAQYYVFVMSFSSRPASCIDYYVSFIEHSTWAFLGTCHCLPTARSEPSFQGEYVFIMIGRSVLRYLCFTDNIGPRPYPYSRTNSKWFVSCMYFSYIRNQSSQLFLLLEVQFSFPQQKKIQWSPSALAEFPLNNNPCHFITQIPSLQRVSRKRYLCKCKYLNCTAKN
jgi:hypothetical protein